MSNAAVTLFVVVLGSAASGVALEAIGNRLAQARRRRALREYRLYRLSTAGAEVETADPAPEARSA